jgi:ABC-type uncharacterized transport system permease subunit
MVAVMESWLSVSLLRAFSPQYGFTGIAVALLGRNHPAGVLLAAIFSER